MLCTICGNDRAKTYIRKAEGREISLTLCSDCYARLYPEREAGDFFTSFVGHTSVSRVKSCTSCGATLEDFRLTGLLGCADCYSVFREELMPTIRYVQGKTKHSGKAPSGDAEERYDLIREQNELEARIKEAEHVRNEAEVSRLKAELERTMAERGLTMVLSSTS